MKFIGIMATMNCSGVNKSYNLAVREYNLTLKERRDNQTSDLLINWLWAIFAEFNIDTDSILISSTDSGSDIKRALEIVFKTLCE